MNFKAYGKPKIVLTLDRKVEVTFTTSKLVLAPLEALKDEELEITIKPFKEKRSLSQNDYLWSLLNKLAIVLNISKEEVYRNFIKDYGVFEIIPIKADVVKSFCHKWSSKGLGWFTEEIGESKLEGFVKLIAYYGSSSYDTAEMTRLLDAVVNDCKELGIETMSYADMLNLCNDNDTY